MSVRRKLQQALAVAAVLMMLTVFSPQATIPSGSESYVATLSAPARAYGGWYGYCCGGGGGGTVANHNETLVEDED